MRWLALTTLLHARGAGPLVTPQSGGRRAGESEDTGNASRLIELARHSWRNGARAADDPVIRDRIMQLAIREDGFALNQKRARVPALAEDMMRIPLQWKLAISELSQDAAALALEIEGAASSLYMADPNAPQSGRWPLAYLNSFGMTIAAGTSEVQRNILGERVLGLPKTR